MGGWPQVTGRAAGVLLARTEPPVPLPRIGTSATPSLTVSSLEWPGPCLHLSSCGTHLYRNSCPRGVPAGSPLCWGAWCPHRHLTALNFVDPVSFSFGCCLPEMPLVPVSPVSACLPSDGPKACKPINSVHSVQRVLSLLSLYRVTELCPYSTCIPSSILSWLLVVAWPPERCPVVCSSEPCHWGPSSPGPTLCCQQLRPRKVSVCDPLP